MREPDSRDLLELATSALLLLACFVVLAGTWRGESGIQTYVALDKSSKLLEDEISRLQTENRNTATEIQRIKKSSSYARKVLRDQYHFLEPDENIILYTK